MVKRDGFAFTLAARDKGQQLIRRLEWKLVKSRIELARLNSIVLKRGRPDKCSMIKKPVQGYRNPLHTANAAA